MIAFSRLFRRGRRDELDRLLGFFNAELSWRDRFRLRRRIRTWPPEGGSLGDKIALTSAVAIIRRMAKEMRSDPAEYRDSLGHIRADGMFDLLNGPYFGGRPGAALAFCCLSACNQDMELGADTYAQLYRDLLPWSIAPPSS